MSRTFHVGEVTIHQLTEFGASFLPVREMLPGLTEEVLEADRHRIGPDALDGADDVILVYQSYVIRTPDAVVLIDTGVGNAKERTRPEWHLRDDDQYLRELAEVGLAVDDIDVVICTHFHLDHVGWNTRLDGGDWVPTFPNAEYVFVSTELAEAEQKYTADGFPPYLDSILPIIQAGRARIVAEDHVVNEYVRLEPTHGHTSGHSMVVVGRERAEAIMTGDMFHVGLQLWHPDLAFVRDVDPVASSATRRAVFERFSDTDTLVCTGHLPAPGVGYLRRAGEGFDLVPPAVEKIHEGKI